MKKIKLLIFYYHRHSFDLIVKISILFALSTLNFVEQLITSK